MEFLIAMVPGASSNCVYKILVYKNKAVGKNFHTNVSTNKFFCLACFFDPSIIGPTPHATSSPSERSEAADVPVRSRGSDAHKALGSLDANASSSREISRVLLLAYLPVPQLPRDWLSRNAPQSLAQLSQLPSARLSELVKISTKKWVAQLRLPQSQRQPKE